MIDIPEHLTSIKEAAELTGLSEDTIRYYEKIGLLPYADRQPNGHRAYSKQQIQGIIFLTRLKATGMTLEQMKNYRELAVVGKSTLDTRLQILKEHHLKVKQSIAELLETQRFLEYTIDHYIETDQNPDIHNHECDAVVSDRMLARHK